MKRGAGIGIVIVLVAVLTAAGFGDDQQQMMAPFGGEEDVAFAQQAWQAIQGYEDWKLQSSIYEGQSPHGAWLKMYHSYIEVAGSSYPVIIKDNFGGEGITMGKVEQDPSQWLAAVTIMVQREEGYDSENMDWFWAKYGSDGTLDTNPNGMKLAGRVAKGMNQGCIACHQRAGGGDLLFFNDR